MPAGDKQSQKLLGGSYSNIGAFIIRTVFGGGMLYCNFNKDPPQKKKQLILIIKAPTVGSGPRNGKSPQWVA